jgi:hypothetical protein
MDLRKEGGEEFLYFAPTGMHKVIKTNLKGEKVFELGYPKDAKNAKGEPCYVDEKKFVPTFIAFAPGDNGDFYVTDGYGSNYVHRYNIKGEYSVTFGGTGSGDGELKCPHGIWCDTRDRDNPMILVADRSNVRLQWFTLDGKFIKRCATSCGTPAISISAGRHPHPRPARPRHDLRQGQQARHAPRRQRRSGQARQPRREAADSDRAVRHAARRDLGSRGEHLRRRVAAVRPRDQAASGLVARVCVESARAMCLAYAGALSHEISCLRAAWCAAAVALARPAAAHPEGFSGLRVKVSAKPSAPRSPFTRAIRPTGFRPGNTPITLRKSVRALEATPGDALEVQFDGQPRPRGQSTRSPRMSGCSSLIWNTSVRRARRR